MDTAFLMTFLLRALGLSYALLMLWFVVFCCAHEPLYRVHARWFRVSREAFDAIHYGGMAVYKIGVLLLFAAPLVALWTLQ